MSIIKFEHAKKSYGDNVIIPDFNLEIDKGEFVTLIGTSGCGKTTLLKMINGLNSLDSGTIYVEGKDIQKENLIELRRNIGYAIQGSGLFPHMSVKDNIAYVPNLLNKRNKAKTKAAVEKWIHVVGLDQDLLDRYPDELSGGQQQRVGIARSLAASPDILLMDEPFGAVDEITRHQLQEEIKRIHDETNVTIIFVTHDIQEALKLGTKILVLESGEIAQYGTAEEIQANPANAYVEKLVHGE
ncbi:ABC transporter ATP-binding protein [Breznakia pachnodae]|uniref:Osmoprotectant transport system ATP-binding protein n=1 Tax=Breznakia pachnodae TaxID=265178 RepID=A0ABU0E1D7_9FIRM|nr:ABC transporter ATP-binding protein [Breznakia pachnodae]MDQ0360697.1 osmoprotectant transport system ATP-binding protein [Breznakia pachnodae]